MVTAKNEFPQPPTRLCFVSMWFHDKLRPVYDFAIKPAANACGYRCVRTDDLPGTFDITSAIIEHIFDAETIVADLTGMQPSVLYEVGVSHVLGHKTILICNYSDKENVPFILRDYRIVWYKTEGKGLKELQASLESSLDDVDWKHKPAGNPVQRARPCKVTERR
jgi:hypothetical protein